MLMQMGVLFSPSFDFQNRKCHNSRFLLNFLLPSGTGREEICFQDSSTSWVSRKPTFKGRHKIVQINCSPSGTSMYSNQFLPNLPFSVHRKADSVW